tara:strand:- start:19973 stop:20374 length:402 start_codon:yes stop_codon:yes gene_type:complete
MANEITYNSSLIATKTNFSERIEPGSIQIDLSSSLEMVAGVKDVDNTANGTEIVATSSGLNSGGMYFFRNLSTAGVVEVGRGPSGSFAPFLSLKPGEYAIGRLATTVPATVAVFAKTTSAVTVELQFKVFDGA